VSAVDESLAAPPLGMPSQVSRQAPQPGSARARSTTLIPRSIVLAGLLLGQLGLALVLDEFRVFALAQAAGLGALGLYAALRRNLPLILCLCAYLPGVEMLWRQTKAPLYYLTAPYLVIALSAFAVILGIGSFGRTARLGLLFIAVLLPAGAVTLKTAGPGARELVSFALTGPIALGALVTFTSQIRIKPELYRRILWIMLISSMGPWMIAVTALREGLAQGDVTFTEQSNFIASGGTAPVQVSALLGMGVLVGVLLILTERQQMARILAVIITAALTVQCFLTFSRGGMTSVAIALSALAITQAGNRQMRNRIIVLVIVALTLLVTVVFPRLDEFTGGAFEKRFTDAKTGRTELAANDYKIFKDNFLFGVGPGMTKYQRLGYDICQYRSDKCMNEASSHTEFTRLLSEHGLAGVTAIVILAMLAFRAYAWSGPRGRPFAVAMIAWAVSQMFYANFRIVAVPFVFALALVRVTGDERVEDHDEPASPSPSQASVGSRPALS